MVWGWGGLHKQIVLGRFEMGRPYGDLPGNKRNGWWTRMSAPPSRGWCLCGTPPLRAKAVVARQREGRTSRERDILHMKSGRALEGVSQRPAKRAATRRTAVKIFCGTLVMMLLCASAVYGQATTRPAPQRSMVVGP